MPCFNGCSNQFRGIALHAEDPIDFLERCGMPSALAMQFRRGRTQLQHLARSQNSPAITGRRRQQFSQCIKRRRTRIVGIVDHRKSVFESHHFAALVSRHKRWKHAPRIFRANSPNARRSQRRHRVHHVVPPDQRQFKPRSSRRRYEIKRRSFDAPLFNFLRAKFRARRSAEPDHRSARHFRKSRHALIVRVQHSRGAGPCQIFNQLALRQRNLVNRSEKLQSAPPPPV